MSKITIYHNPACSNSRGALALLRERGFEPQVVEYLATPPDRQTLVSLVKGTGLPVRALMRSKEPAFEAAGLADPSLSDDQLIDAMLAHPILINRPIVVTPLGTRLCRPPQTLLEILPDPAPAA